MLQLDTRPSFRARLLSLAALCSLTALVAGFFPGAAFAARVTKANATSVIIDLEGVDMKVGDKAFLLDGGKKKALVQITQVKNGRAAGRVTKGSAQVGYDVQAAPSILRSSGHSSSEASSSSKKTRKRVGRRDVEQILVGGVLGYSMDTQSVKASNTSGTVSENVAMSGSGFAGKALLDMPISGSLGLIGRFGAETFNLTGSSTSMICANSTSCTTSITYLSGDMLIRYSFLSGDIQPYLAVGLGLHFPLSKSSNILDENQISTTTIFFGGGGLYWRIGDGEYIPLQIEYGYFPPSNSVTTSIISARIGYAFTL